MTEQSASRSDEEPLPCPCCGGEAQFDSITDDTASNYDGRFIRCIECELSTNLVFPHKGDVRRELLEMWNKRAPRSERLAFEDADRHALSNALHRMQHIELTEYTDNSSARTKALRRPYALADARKDARQAKLSLERLYEKFVERQPERNRE